MCHLHLFRVKFGGELCAWTFHFQKENYFSAGSKTGEEKTPFCKMETIFLLYKHLFGSPCSRSTAMWREEDRDEDMAGPWQIPPLQGEVRTQSQRHKSAATAQNFSVPTHNPEMVESYLNGEAMFLCWLSCAAVISAWRWDNYLWNSKAALIYEILGRRN